MSYSLKVFVGHARDIEEHNFLEDVNQENWPDREREFVEELVDDLQSLAQRLGGHVSVSAYGHVNPSPAPGDNLVVNLNAVPDPGVAGGGDASAPAAQTGTTEAPASVAPGSTPLEAQAPAQPADTTGLTPVVTSQGPDLGPSAVPLDTAPDAGQSSGPAVPAADQVPPVAATAETPAGEGASEPTLAMTSDQPAQDVRAASEQAQVPPAAPSPEPAAVPGAGDQQTAAEEPAATETAGQPEPATADPGADQPAPASSDVPDVAAPSAAPGGTVGDPATSEPQSPADVAAAEGDQPAPEPTP